MSYEETVRKEVQRVTEMVAGLRQLADFIEENPDLALYFGATFNKVIVYAGSNDPRAVMADFARAALKVGATVTKDFEGDKWASVLLNFGPIVVDVYGSRDEVCSQMLNDAGVAAIPAITSSTPPAPPPPPSGAMVELPSEPDEHAELVAANVELAELLAAARWRADDQHRRAESLLAMRLALVKQVHRLECEVERLRAVVDIRRNWPGTDVARLQREVDQHRRNCLVLSDALAVAECRIGGMYAPLADPKRAELLLERVRAAVAEDLGLERVR